jgi:hypothetical protein
VIFQSGSCSAKEMVGHLAHIWNLRLYRQIHGSAVGHIGQQSGTLEDGLEGIDELATAYEKFILLAHVDFAKSICLLVPAPFTLLR